MINKLFNGYKFKRTYIGGSIKDENYTFQLIGGVEEDGSDCDWIEWKNLWETYFNDILQILFTWKVLTLRISLGLILASILFFKFSVISYVLIGFSVLLMLIHFIFNIREKRMKGAYDLTLGVCDYNIKALYGLIKKSK